MPASKPRAGDKRRVAPAAAKEPRRKPRAVVERRTEPRAVEAPEREPRGRTPAARPKVRMYCHGLGDCFLVTLPRSDREREPFRIMIDCGVILGTPDAKALMERVVADIEDASGGRVNLLLVTHEHWDHVSGFLQAREGLERIRFDAVWMGWTESPEDPQARRLEAERARAFAALRLAEGRMRVAGAAEEAEEVSGLLDFFGAAAGAGRSSRDAVEAARALDASGGPRYAEPGEAPAPLAGTDARLYVLGPPRNEDLLLRSDPSRRAPETYGFGLAGFPMEDVEECLRADAPQGPFGPRMSIPMDVGRAMPEFRRYWADGPGGAGEGEGWRRIDLAWLDGSSDLALRLDHDTNNSSLAVAIEIGDDEVLLFAADAQVGNWLSWQKLEWEVEGRRVTGPDLLARTVFYKVGHHGSHNATLREKGLEVMGRLRVAAIPVDQEMAKKRRWGRMPLPELVATRLEAKTNGRVLRSDVPAPAGIYGLIEGKPDGPGGRPLYIEFDL